MLQLHYTIVYYEEKKIQDTIVLDTTLNINFECL